MIGIYYGTLVNTDLSHDNRTKKTYGEGIMGVKVIDFERWEMQVASSLEDGSNERRSLYIVDAHSLR